MTQTPEPLGRILGRVLDRSALPESGSAVVLHTNAGDSEQCRVHWRTASVWRVQTRGSLSASDGTITCSTDRDHATRPRVHLLGTEDDRRGSLLVDSVHGFLREICFSDGTRLELRDVDLRPQPHALFVRP